MTELESAHKALCVIETIKRLNSDGESHKMMSHDEEYHRHDARKKMLDMMERMKGEAHTDHERQYMSEWIKLVENS